MSKIKLEYKCIVKPIAGSKLNSKMVGEVQSLVLEEILNEKQIHRIMHRAIGQNVAWVLKCSEVRPAVDGIAGFLGDHMKAVLDVDVQGKLKKVHLFLKRLPMSNKPKSDFIDGCNYFRREMLMYRLLEDFCDYGPNPWCVKAYVYTDSLIVMPDLNAAGYSCRHFLETLDSEHIFLTTTSIARFHAAFVNYESKKGIDQKRPYRIFEEYGHILNESTFLDCPWLKAAAKLSANLFNTFSTQSYRNLPDLESKLYKLYLKACDVLTEYEDSLNVLIHKDLWVNNILYKYENGVPTSALLVDFQCMRYVPPAFDLMIFLYLATDRSFREQHEKDVFDKYYSTFVENLTPDSKKRIEGLGYDKENFLKWCETARMVGIFEAITIFPFTLMDPKTAQKTFDDPETYDKHINYDRSEPVLAHALKCEVYKKRNLEVTEDFVERYILN